MKDASETFHNALAALTQNTEDLSALELAAVSGMLVGYFAAYCLSRGGDEKHIAQCIENGGEAGAKLYYADRAELDTEDARAAAAGGAHGSN